MTPAQEKSQTIELLTKLIDQTTEIAAANHGDTLTRLRETEGRLAKKIEEQGVRVDNVITHCADRKREVDALIAAGLVTTEASITRAALAAVTEATKPSPYRIVTKGLANFAVKLVAFAAACTGVALAVHSFWN